MGFESYHIKLCLLLNLFSLTLTHFQLLDLDLSVTDMTIDWISRTIFIAAKQKQNNTSIITSYQLDEGKQTLRVERRGVVISSLIRHPYSR